MECVCVCVCVLMVQKHTLHFCQQWKMVKTKNNTYSWEIIWTKHSTALYSLLIHIFLVQMMSFLLKQNISSRSLHARSFNLLLSRSLSFSCMPVFLALSISFSLAASFTLLYGTCQDALKLSFHLETNVEWIPCLVSSFMLRLFLFAWKFNVTDESLGWAAFAFDFHISVWWHHISNNGAALDLKMVSKLLNNLWIAATRTEAKASISTKNEGGGEWWRLHFLTCNSAYWSVALVKRRISHIFLPSTSQTNRSRIST